MPSSGTFNVLTLMMMTSTSIATAVFFFSSVISRFRTNTWHKMDGHVKILTVRFSAICLRNSINLSQQKPSTKWLKLKGTKVRGYPKKGREVLSREFNLSRLYLRIIITGLLAYISWTLPFFGGRTSALFRWVERNSSNWNDEYPIPIWGINLNKFAFEAEKLNLRSVKMYNFPL